jgi:tetratricopeptide (TPR) repeat protein
VIGLKRSAGAPDDKAAFVQSPITTHQSLRQAAASLAALLLLAHFAARPALAGEVEWRMLQDQAAAHLQRGNFEQAELFGRAALKEAEASLGPDHRATETSLSTLSAALRLRGKAEDALPLVQRLVVIRTKLYGPEDPSTALALHNNAEILIALDRFTEAELLQGRALAVFEKKLGPTHANTAIALHNMGAILLKQEKYKEAEAYLRRALAAKEKALKPGHLSIAHTLDNLSAALDAQGRKIEAEKAKRRAEAIRRKAAQS